MLTRPSFSTGYARNASESANPNLWKGLVGAWMPSFGVTGGTLKDAVGNANPVSQNVLDPVVWESSKIGLVYDFETYSRAVGGDLSSKILNGYTFLAYIWRRLTDTREIASQWGAAGAGNASWILRSESGYLRFGNHDGASSLLQSSVLLAYREWQHVAVSWDGSTSGTNAHIYYDGKLVTSGTLTNGVQVSTNYPLEFGTIQGGRHWSGKIGCFQAYNRALSSAEIKQLYINPSAPFQKKTVVAGFVPKTFHKVAVLKKPEPSFVNGYARNASESARPHLWKGLVGAWVPSLGVTGDTLRDVSGNGNDVVQVGAGAGWQASSLRNGSVNRYNPGGNRYMIAEDAASLQPTSLTASFWVNMFNLYSNESGFIDKQADPNASQNYLNACFHGNVYAGYLQFRLASPSNVNHVLIGDASTYGGSNTLFSNFLNKWLHVACTYDEKTGQANLYRDGQKVATRTSSPSPLKTGTGDLLINAIHYVNRFALSGLMNSMLIHNRALSPSEIKELFIKPLAPFERKSTVVGAPAPPPPPVTNYKAVKVIKSYKPSFKTGYARNASESANPSLWKGLAAWIPALGHTGSTIKNIRDGSRGLLNDGTTLSGTTQQSLSEADYLSFDGLDDYMRIYDTSLKTFGYTNPDESLAVCFRRKSFTGDTALWGYLSAGFLGSYGRGFYFSDSQMHCVSETNNNNAPITTTVADKKWHIAIANFSSNGAFYLDGKLIGTGTLNSSWTYWLQLASASAHVAPPANGANADVDVKVAYQWDRLLSYGEIKSLSTNPLAPFEMKDTFAAYKDPLPPVRGLFRLP